MTITPGFTEFTRTFFGANSNATHLDHHQTWGMLFFAHLATWSFGPVQPWRYCTPIPYKEDTWSKKTNPSTWPTTNFHLHGCLTQEKNGSRWHWTHWQHFPWFSQDGELPAWSSARLPGRWLPSPWGKLQDPTMRKFNVAQAEIVLEAFCHSDWN